jgi:hypothetical protein
MDARLPRRIRQQFQLESDNIDRPDQELTAWCVVYINACSFKEYCCVANLFLS